nr:hypothetical protein [Haloferax profundi]
MSDACFFIYEDGVAGRVTGYMDRLESTDLLSISEQVVRFSLNVDSVVVYFDHVVLFRNPRFDIIPFAHFVKRTDVVEVTMCDNQSFRFDSDLLDTFEEVLDTILEAGIHNRWDVSLEIEEVRSVAFSFRDVRTLVGSLPSDVVDSIGDIKFSDYR